MTAFEELANELNISLTTDEYGLYSGMARALALVCTDVLLDPVTRDLDWAEQEPVIKEKFFRKFPYMVK